MRMSRRGFMGACACSGAGLLLANAGKARAESGPVRRYHASLSPEALDTVPEILEIVQKAGVSHVWVAGYFYGYWPEPAEKVVERLRRIESMGMAADVINIPLGHPGDSLGSQADGFPLTPPKGWALATGVDGTKYSGTSLHPPATEGNVEAMRTLQKLGVKRVFLDDDFRLARGPGVIGGCFCEACRQEFCDRYGYGDAQWTELLESVQTRSLTEVLRGWVEFTCDRLTGCFRAQQAAAPDIELGNMIMYLGSEKAGIRLADYADTLFRVGELMFNDASFAPAKGKTDELFSALFHRRYAKPELAYSESTAYPADQLSAGNMAAKLVVSTIADVRNTMYMSGLTPFPVSHWDILASAMKREAEAHAVLAGHAPRGPFKHFWGEHSRMVGDDKPFSLFLATGVPFEVTDSPSEDGWTFLSDDDARAGLKSPGTTFVARPGASVQDGVRALPEALPDLFALKHEIVPTLKGVPYVEEDKPVVCAWYPSAKRAYLWNLAETRETFTLVMDGKRRSVEVAGLESALLDVL